jgi:sucrose-6-phosphate hydrolase SacC (GH32 family)
MADIILDTNALRLLLDNEYVEKIIKKCDHIFTSKQWRNADEYIKELQIGRTILQSNIRKLYDNNKIHETSGKINLPENIQRELNKKNASNGDFEISQIAYTRRISGQNIFLVSKDHHILDLKEVFISNGIVIETLEQELKRA